MKDNNLKCVSDCDCSFKRCKICNNRYTKEWFKISSNSDDGLFPFCNKCVKRLVRVQEINWARYFDKNVRDKNG